VLHDGRLKVPSGPGLGVTVDENRLHEVTTAVEVVRPRASAVRAGSPPR